MQPRPPEPSTLDNILITEALSQRSPRTPNWQAEAQAMQPLAQQMARDPGDLLQVLVDIALTLCQAGTAGVSLLETTPEGTEIFRWTTMTGRLAQAGGSTPRNFSPCGVCLDRGTPQLFSHPERYFTYFQEANIPIIEGLVLPLVAEDRAPGTIWIMSHDEAHHFDSEDVRVMTNLANFTTAALLLKQQQTQDLLVANTRLEIEIADRKQTEIQLRAAGERQRLASETANFGIYEFIAATAQLTWSPLLKAIHGLPEDAEVTPEHLHTFVHPDDRTQFLEGLAQLQRPDAPELYEHEFRIVRTDGEVRWLLDKGQIFFKGEGDQRCLERIIGVTYDITDRQRVEAALRQSEQHLLRTTEAAQIGTWQWNLKTNEVVWSPLMKKLLGCESTPGPNSHEDWVARLNEEDRRCMAAGLPDWIQAGKDVDFEYRVKIPGTNETRWLRSIGRVECDRQGQPEIMQGIAIDITDRRRREQHQALLSEISRDLVGLESITETMDRLGKKIGRYFGVKYCMFAEHTDEFETSVAAYGWNDADVPSIRGTYRLRDFLADAELAAILTGEPLIVSDTKIDARVNTESYGALNIYSFIIVPLLRHHKWQFQISIIDNEPRQWRDDEVDLMQEITNRVWARLERAHAEVALQQSEIQRVQEQAARDQEYQRAEALAELARAKTQFFSNISHEFRTPLTLILGPLAEVLATLEEDNKIEQPLPVHLQEQLQIAHRNGLRLLKLVNTLLEFSRIEADCLQAHHEPTDLSTYTAELASVFRSTIESAGLQLIVDCPPLPEPVYVDREMWEKIILNLLSNAFKFTFTGTISVSLKLKANQVELTITDTGIGIPAQDLPHLFERFYQIKGSQGRSYEGSGIGLSLVQELVKRHSGTTRVTSELNQGTRFTITLPTGHSHLPTAEINLSSPQSATTNGVDYYITEISRWLPETDVSLHNIDLELEEDIQDVESFMAESPSLDSSTAEQTQSKVLIVDDNADMRDYLSRLLHQQYQVAAVNDGLAALDAIPQQKPDLILADVMMPRMDGLALLRSLRENPQTQDIPMILLSARAGETAKIEGLTAGADDYLVKPFAARELLARIDAHLKLARMRREVAAQAQMMQTIQILNERLEQRVTERTVQLQALNQELEAFAYSVSHDLRTPLRYISSFAEQLQNQLDAGLPTPTASPLSILSIIQRSALAAEQMVDNLLAFSRSSQSEMHRTLVPLDVLVQQVQTQLQPETASREIQWHIAALPTVKGDPTLLQLVLQNLLSNAVKYTRDRHPAEISIDSWETDTEYVVVVKDNGAGFDMKYSDRLFQLFQRLHTQETFAGTGVGLANVRRIIHRHGGRTWAEGMLNQGAIFYFSLPK
jgi:PAS domain S-box-containing protein